MRVDNAPLKRSGTQTSKPVRSEMVSAMIFGLEIARPKTSERMTMALSFVPSWLEPLAKYAPSFSVPLGEPGSKFPEVQSGQLMTPKLPSKQSA